MPKHESCIRHIDTVSANRYLTYKMIASCVLRASLSVHPRTRSNNAAQQWGIRQRRPANRWTLATHKNLLYEINRNVWAGTALQLVSCSREPSLNIIKSTIYFLWRTKWEVQFVTKDILVCLLFGNIGLVKIVGLVDQSE